MSSGRRERRLVFYLFPGRGALPQGNVSENRTLGYKLKCVSRSKSVSVCSKHISSTTTTTHIGKACGPMRSLLRWMDNIPKGPSPSTETSVRKWRTALIYFHLYFSRHFLPVVRGLDEARFPPIPQVASIFTAG